MSSNALARPQRRFICFYCKKQDTDVRACNTCKAVSYCGKQCQTSDWPEHKKTCCRPSHDREVELRCELMLSNVMAAVRDLPPARQALLVKEDQLLQHDFDLQSYIDRLCVCSAQAQPSKDSVDGIICGHSNACLYACGMRCAQQNNDAVSGMRALKLLLANARKWPPPLGPDAHGSREADMAEYEALFGAPISTPVVARY